MSLTRPLGWPPPQFQLTVSPLPLAFFELDPAVALDLDLLLLLLDFDCFLLLSDEICSSSLMSSPSSLGRAAFAFRDERVSRRFGEGDASLMGAESDVLRFLGDVLAEDVPLRGSCPQFISDL